MVKVYLISTLSLLFGFIVSAQEAKLPNVIIVYTDDLGYGDLGCYGNPTIHTPHLDKMASEGMKFTQFNIAANICTPSRAALLTGCYPKRVGLHKGVLRGTSKIGLNSNETTLAEILQQEGYKTACFGKWHLGHQEQFLPTKHGFDVFWGFPFSNDMSKKEQVLMGNNKYAYSLPLISQSDTLDLDPDQSVVTCQLTDKTVQFIKEQRRKPFFIYLTYPMPHVPLYASNKFKGKSKRGLYGDAVEELDWGVGQIMAALKANKLDKNTLVLFSSDNGPWSIYKTKGGSSGPLRGAKGSTWEGGHRVPLIAWWPDKIGKGETCTQYISNMDILPTITRLVGGQLPEKIIDGRDITDLFEEPYKVLKEEPFFYYSSKGILQGVRLGAMKLISVKGDFQLYNIEEDISEAYNLAKKQPGDVERLKSIMYQFDKKLEKESRLPGSINNLNNENLNPTLSAI
ncbi:MAG: sulfatase [Carboxylicivirga sp.]|jgi:arylsulfatase A-like enzyme|nr:sulfatase [Carboxylicivirga sp.]